MQKLARTAEIWTESHSGRGLLFTLTL